MIAGGLILGMTNVAFAQESFCLGKIQESGSEGKTISQNIRSSAGYFTLHSAKGIGRYVVGGALLITSPGLILTSAGAGLVFSNKGLVETNQRATYKLLQSANGIQDDAISTNTGKTGMKVKEYRKRRNAHILHDELFKQIRKEIEVRNSKKRFVARILKNKRNLITDVEAFNKLVVASVKSLDTDPGHDEKALFCRVVKGEWVPRPLTSKMKSAIVKNVLATMPLALLKDYRATDDQVPAQNQTENAPSVDQPASQDQETDDLDVEEQLTEEEEDGKK